MNRPHLSWEELTWMEAAALARDRPVALLPMGSTEAHGPHLPLNTDVIISLGMARRAAEALRAREVPAVVLPALAYGVTEFAGGFGGTLGVSPETLAAILNDLARGLVRRGIHVLCLVNSHLEPGHIAVLRRTTQNIPASLGVQVIFPDKTRRRWVQSLSEEFQSGACHAGSYETSLVLAERPELVRDALRKDLKPLPINLTTAMQSGARTFEEAGAVDAYFGDPAAGSVEEGEALYGRLVEMIVTTVLESRASRGGELPPTD